MQLEHLENVFYHNALKNFTQQDFINAGYSAAYYNNLKYISYDEQSHVQLLTNALNAANQKPAAACSYKFPYTDVKSFITLSSILEGVGTSAYLGGAPLITNKAYLTVAGSILVTEALHTSMQRSAVGEVPMANPYGTPLDPTSVYSLAAMFITSCPPGNPSLPFVPYPSLTYMPNNAGYCEQANCAPSAQIKRAYNDWASVTTTRTSTSTRATSTTTSTTSMMPTPSPNMNMPPASAGTTITLVAASNVPAGSYVTFVSGLNVVSVPGTISGTTIRAQIPAVAQGQTYVFVSRTDQETNFDGTNILFGPAIVEVNPAPPAIDFSIN